MPVIAKLRDEIDEAKTLAEIADIFTELSSVKIKKIRRAFERNASFYEEIAQLYHLTNLIAARRGLSREMGQEPQKRLLSIAVTSNHRFYGALNLNVLEKFRRAVQLGKGDCLVIGRTGAEYLVDSGKLATRCQVLIFEDDFPRPAEVRRLMEKTSAYGQILVYYPKFINVFRQEVAVWDITQIPTQAQVEFQRVDFIFEPELGQIVRFFREQVRTLLFNRAMLEAELSRTAARLLAMSLAQDRAEGLLKKKHRQLRQAARALKNARLLESVASLSRHE